MPAKAGYPVRRGLSVLSLSSPGILDHPPKPVIGRRVAPTRWRVMTAEIQIPMGSLKFTDPEFARGQSVAEWCAGVRPPRGPLRQGLPAAGSRLQARAPE